MGCCRQVLWVHLVREWHVKIEMAAGPGAGMWRERWTSKWVQQVFLAGAALRLVGCDKAGGRASVPSQPLLLVTVGLQGLSRVHPWKQTIVPRQTACCTHAVCLGGALRTCHLTPGETCCLFHVVHIQRGFGVTEEIRAKNVDVFEVLTGSVHFVAHAVQDDSN